MISKSTTTNTKPLKPSLPVWKPHQYQKDSIKFLLEHAGGGLFADPGAGKTGITLGACKVLKKKGLLGKVLIVAPLRPCYMVWPGEMEKWEDFKDFSYTILHGKDKDANARKDVDFYIINPEGLPWLLENKRFKKIGIDRLVVDECSFFKHPSSQRFKNLKQILDYMRSRWILTGSPAARNYLDLFGQIYIADQGAALGRFITHYRHRFFYPSGYGGYTWTLQPGAKEKIQEAIEPLIKVIRVTELPELIETDVIVQLPPAARKVYLDMEHQFLSAIGDNMLVAANAAAASTKCRQIANGGLYKNDREGHAAKSDEWVEIHDAKAQAVKEIVDELQGQPCLIAYEFDHDLERLKKVLGKDTLHIGGGVTPKRSAEIVKLWNEGKLDKLLVHPKSVAHGLNMQASGHHIIIASLFWNYEHYDQLIRRLRRQGATFSQVTVIRVVADDTVDEDVVKSLYVKGSTQDELMQALISRQKARKRK